MILVSVLFARENSNYKLLDGVDVWDKKRDATKWKGGTPIVAHPPCRAWGRLRKFSNPIPGEKEYSIWAIEQIRKYGGVLEHPSQSTLWGAAELPVIGMKDIYGGWTLPIYQHSFGHRAQKKTWLYICGCEPKEIPVMPLVLGRATHCIKASKNYPRLPTVTKEEREHTPIDLAVWLIELARRCKIKGRKKDEI